jgi:two-component system, OmpR family, sensor histidine kinase KdpD
VPMGEEKRVFEKFHRAAREGSPGGAGLGLAICHAIVTAHGGRIWVQNREPRGASFRFVLPIVGQAPTMEAPAMEAPAIDASAIDASAIETPVLEAASTEKLLDEAQREAH